MAVEVEVETFRRLEPLNSEDSFAAAEELIEKAKSSGETNIDLSAFPNLESIPDNISEIDGIYGIDISETKLISLDPLYAINSIKQILADNSMLVELEAVSSLENIELLSLRNTPVHDLSPLSNLSKLDTLYLEGTKVSDLNPISEVTSIEDLTLMETHIDSIDQLARLVNLIVLDLDDTNISDIRIISNFKKLEKLYLSRTNISKLDALSELRYLDTLWIAGTKISNLEAIRGLSRLRSLWFSDTLVDNLEDISDLDSITMLSIRDTKINDISVLQNFNGLQYLDIDSTRIEDLSPLTGLKSLQDAAMLFRGRNAGLSYRGTPASRLPPFDHLVHLEQPQCTVETINEIRNRQGLESYHPTDYSAPANTDRISEDEDESEIREQLLQRPASHSFAFRKGRIESRAQSFSPQHYEIAEDIRLEVANKAYGVANRLASCNAPGRVIFTVDRLNSALGTNLSDIRAGILQMRFRSLQADIAAYDTEEGRRELPEDAFSMLADLGSSIEDLMACFPQLAEIEAERLAQRLKDTDAEQVVEALSEIRKVAENSRAVAPSALEALVTGEPELAHDNEIIETDASDTARSAAIVARDRTLGYMLLVYRNFVASAVKVGSEMGGLGTDTWKEVRKKVPEQATDAGIALSIALLVNALLGPTAAAAAFAVSFKPLSDRAKKVVGKLEEITSAKSEPDEPK